MQEEHGFTLLELLVALVIGAVVVMGVHAAVTVSTDVALRGRDRADGLLRVEAARMAIQRWLEGAYLGGAAGGGAFRGRDRDVLGRPADELTFVTLDPGLLGEAPGSRVQVRLRIAAADSGLVAEYAKLGPVASRAESRERRIAVAPEIRGMEIRYLVALGDQLRWFSGWSSRTRLPQAVEIRFFPAPDDSLPSLLQLPLLVALRRQG